MSQQLNIWVCISMKTTLGIIALKLSSNECASFLCSCIGSVVCRAFLLGKTVYIELDESIPWYGISLYGMWSNYKKKLKSHKMLHNIESNIVYGTMYDDVGKCKKLRILLDFNCRISELVCHFNKTVLCKMSNFQRNRKLPGAFKLSFFQKHTQKAK